MATELKHAGWLDPPEGYDPIGQPDFDNNLADYWDSLESRQGAQGMEYWTGDGYTQINSKSTPAQVRAAHAEHLRREMWKQANPDHPVSKDVYFRYTWDPVKKKVYPTPPPWKDFDVSTTPGKGSDVNFKQPWVSDPPDTDNPWQDLVDPPVPEPSPWPKGYEPVGRHPQQDLWDAPELGPIGEPVVNDFPSEEAFELAGISPEKREEFGRMVVGHFTSLDDGNFFERHLRNKIVKGIIQLGNEKGLDVLREQTLDVAELPGINSIDRFLLNATGHVTQVGHFLDGLDYQMKNKGEILGNPFLLKDLYKKDNPLYGDYYKNQDKALQEKDNEWVTSNVQRAKAAAEAAELDPKTDPRVIEDNILNLSRSIIRQAIDSGELEPEGSMRHTIFTLGESLKTWPEAQQNEILDILAKEYIGPPSMILEQGGLGEYINRLNILAPGNEDIMKLKRFHDTTSHRGHGWFGGAAQAGELYAKGDLYTPGHEDVRLWEAGTPNQKELSKDFWAKNPTAEDVLDIQDALEISRELGNLTNEQAYQTYQQIMGDRKIEQLATGKDWKTTFVRETEQDKINRLRNFQDLLGKGKELVGKAMPGLEGQKQLLSGVLKSADDWVNIGSTAEKSAWDLGSVALDEWKQRQTMGDAAGQGGWNPFRGMPGYGTVKKFLTGKDNPGGFQTGPTEAARRALQASGRLAKVGGNIGASLVAGFLEENYLDPAAQKAGKWLGEEVLRPIGQAIDDFLPGISSEDERQRLQEDQEIGPWQPDMTLGDPVADPEEFDLGKNFWDTPPDESTVWETIPEESWDYGGGLKGTIPESRTDVTPAPGEPPPVLPEGSTGMYGHVPYELTDQYGSGEMLIGIDRKWKDEEDRPRHELTWLPTQGGSGPWSGGSWGDEGDNEPVTLHDGTVVPGNAYHNSPLFDAIREYDAQQANAPVDSIPDTSAPSPKPIPIPGTPPTPAPTGPEADFYNPYEGQGDMVFPGVVYDYYHPDTGRHYSVGPPMSPKDGSGWVSNPSATYDGKGNISKQRKYPAPPGHPDAEHPQYIDPTPNMPWYQKQQAEEKQAVQPTPPPTADKPSGMLGQWTKEETEGMVGAGGMVELPDGSWTTGHAWANDKELHERVAAWEKEQLNKEVKGVIPETDEMMGERGGAIPETDEMMGDRKTEMEDWLPEHDFEHFGGEMWLAVMNDWYNPERRKHYSTGAQFQPKEGTGWERNPGPTYDGQGNIITPRKYLKPGDPGYVEYVDEPGDHAYPPTTPPPVGGAQPTPPTIQPIPTPPTVQPIPTPQPQPPTAQPQPTPIQPIDRQIEPIPEEVNLTDPIRGDTPLPGQQPQQQQPETSPKPSVPEYQQETTLPGLQPWTDTKMVTNFMRDYRHSNKKRKKIKPYAPSSGGGVLSMRIGGVNY